MSWSQSNESSTKLDALVEMGRRQARAPGPAELDAGLELVTTRLEADRRRRQRWRRVAPVVSVLLVGLVTLMVVRPWALQPTALKYDVQGGEILDAGYLREMDGRGVVVSFEEGTQFALAPGARARLRSVDARGARLGLESGSASFQVVPDATRRWEVEVGPFLVQVKGTTFNVDWDPVVEQFRLDLEHGKVLVSGPVSGGELTLKGGQRLVVHLGKGETRILESRTAEAAPSTASASGASANGASANGASATTVTADAPAAPLLDATSATLAPEPSTPEAEAAVVAADEDPSSLRESGKRRKHDWSRALARGDWDDILSDAAARGIPHVLATSSAEELFTLATAARYRQRSSLALQTLLALRERYPTSSRARDAAFLLGRVAESRGETKQADTWYREYLTAAPRGAYASEALGRRMTLQSRTAGKTSARSLAEEYLRLFPKGSYAGAARALTDGP